MKMVFSKPKHFGAICVKFIWEQLCAFSWFNKSIVIHQNNARNEQP
jgi:hypothetical protein